MPTWRLFLSPVVTTFLRSGLINSETGFDKNEGSRKMNQIIRPKWAIWCVEAEDGKFHGYGTRKLHQLDIEAEIDYGLEISSCNGFFREMTPSFVRHYNLTSTIGGFTMIQVDTELEAISTLFNIFRQEEREEEEERARAEEARRLAAEHYNPENDVYNEEK